jgi:hypothetical protein
LRLAQHYCFRCEATLIDNLVLALYEILRDHDLLRFLFFLNGPLLLSLLYHLVELGMLGRSLGLNFFGGLALKLILLVHVEVVNYVCDVGHWVGFGRGGLE